MKGIAEISRHAIVFALSIMVMLAASHAFAIQHDAPYLMELNKHQNKWQQEDKSLNDKLAELEKKFGKKPNLIYILADDIGWGELGSYGMGKLRGNPTPGLDKLAKRGMKFLQSYAEPSCTPSRIAIMTGRHPVRTGVNGVIWPGQSLGLPASEVTIAELLKKAGYTTAMFGKWHLGDAEEMAPENQGFDYAYYGLYNGAPFAWPGVPGEYKRDEVLANAYFFDYPGDEEYKKRYGIDIQGIFEAKDGKARQEVMKLSASAMDKIEAHSIKKILEIIEQSKTSDKPFFIYWATYANQLAGSPKEVRSWPGVDKKNNNAVQFTQHDAYVKQVMEALDEHGLAENTLLVWISDNGPMYAFYPSSNYSWLRGEKGQVYEGGVRVPAIAYWKGMIEPGQDPLDFLHITDLFATAATLGGVADKIPDDRITDGINQLPLLLNGEGHGRRHYIFHYNGAQLGAVRLHDFKMILKGPLTSSIPQMEMYNIKRDPGEKFGHVYPYLFLIAPFQQIIGSHMGVIKKYPHHVLPSAKK